MMLFLSFQLATLHVIPNTASLCLLATLTYQCHEETRVLCSESALAPLRVQNPADHNRIIVIPWDLRQCAHSGGEGSPPSEDNTLPKLPYLDGSAKPVCISNAGTRSKTYFNVWY